MKKLFILTISTLCFTSCSQFSNSPTSRAWHNLNAKYNALLIARDNFKIAGLQAQKDRKENFGTVLPIYYPIDSNSISAYKPQLEEVIKKTSLIAERHSNSRYLDEAYLLLGKARFLKGENHNAIETFKYVNTKGKTPERKNEALVWLIRSYTEAGDFNTASQVADLLKTSPLSPRIKELYLLCMAHFHQVQGEEALAAVLLEEALKTMQKSPEKARLHFIAGQLFDKLNRPVLARKNYQMAKKSRPSYDIEFNAGMGLLMNQSLAANSRGSFEQMLEDRKNADLKDKIYFRMGELEARKKNYPDAIAYLQKSVAEATEDQVQKAYSYKAIGDIYFDHLNDFESAAPYYDSTIITIPKNLPDYKILNAKASSLNDFLRYKKGLDLEDSLQRLASMNPLALDNKLEEIVQEQEKEKKRLSEAAKAVAAKQTQAPSAPAKPGKRWLLYDPVELVKSRNEFIRIWGNRPLEDNWRRGSRTSGFVSFKVERGTVPSDSSEAAPAQVDAESDKEAQMLAFRKSELLEKIPKTPMQMAASKRKQEEAYYQLGKIYKLKFGNDTKARETFLKLTENFPNSIYLPEAYYFLAIIEPDNNNIYKTALLEKYPNSSFARQLRRGQVKMTSDREGEAQVLYAGAFRSYNSGDYDNALKTLEQGLNEYTGSLIEDKMAMLRIIILAKSQNKDQYMIALQDFLRSYPNSELTLRAKDMLTVMNKNDRP